MAAYCANNLHRSDLLGWYLMLARELAIEILAPWSPRHILRRQEYEQGKVEEALVEVREVHCAPNTTALCT